MFVPLHDSTPLKVIRFQSVTVTIIAINVVMYLTTGAFAPERVLDTVAAGWGVVPGELTHMAAPILGYEPVPEPLTLLSYMFLHAGWWHLISNMLFLWVFADNIEDAYGHGAFALPYLTAGVMAALVYTLLSPSSNMPLVGAFRRGLGRSRRLCGAVPQGAGVDPAVPAHSAAHRRPVGAGRLVSAAGLLLVDGPRKSGGRHSLGCPYWRLSHRRRHDLCHPPPVVVASQPVNAVPMAPESVAFGHQAALLELT